MAVADVYDALVSRRTYKEPLPHERAAAILAEGRGTHFDPDMLDAFLAHQERFRAIAARFAEPARSPGHRQDRPGDRRRPPLTRPSRGEQRDARAIPPDTRAFETPGTPLARRFNPRLRKKIGKASPGRPPADAPP